MQRFRHIAVKIKLRDNSCCACRVLDPFSFQKRNDPCTVDGVDNSRHVADDGLQTDLARVCQSPGLDMFGHVSKADHYMHNCVIHVMYGYGINLQPALLTVRAYETFK